MPVVQLTDTAAILHEFAQLSSENSVCGRKRSSRSEGEESNETSTCFSFSTMDDYSVANTIMTSNEQLIEESNINEYDSLLSKYYSTIDNNKILSSRLIKSQQCILSFKEKVNILAQQVDQLKSEKDQFRKLCERLHTEFEDHKEKHISVCWKRLQHRLDARDNFASCDLSSSFYKQSNKQPLRDFIMSSNKANYLPDEAEIDASETKIAQHVQQYTLELDESLDQDEALASETSKVDLNKTENEIVICVNDDEHYDIKSEDDVDLDKGEHYDENSEGNEIIIIPKENNLNLANYSIDGSEHMTPIIEESFSSTSSNSSADEKEPENQAPLSIEAKLRPSSSMKGFQTLSLSSNNDKEEHVATPPNLAQRHLNVLISKWVDKSEARAKDRAIKRAAVQASHPVLKIGMANDESKNVRGLLKLIPKLSRRDMLEKSLIDTSEKTHSDLLENTQSDISEKIPSVISEKTQSDTSKKPQNDI